MNLTRMIYALLAAVLAGWSLFVYNLYDNAIRDDAEGYKEVARSEARIAFEKDITYRRWSSNVGGVYVEITDDLQPNKYLDVPNRDVTTSDGKKLTLVNPAYMTRMVHGLMTEKDGLRAHITSLNPIRPENAADAWEAKALESFNQGQKEAYEFVTEGGERFLRFMRPMVTERSCLRCHAKQGYTEGDIRGGISVMVPMRQYDAALHAASIGTRNRYISILLAGVGLLATIFAVLVVNERIRSKAALALAESGREVAESEQRFRTLYERAPVGIMLVDSQGKVKTCNTRFAEIFGTTPQSYEGMSLLDTLQDDRFRDATAMLLRTGECRAEGPYVSVVTGKQLYIRESGTRLDRDLYILILEDITEAKRSEESLRLGKAFMAMSMEMAAMGHWQFDVPSKTFSFTDEFYSLYATSAEREGGYIMSAEKYAKEFVHPDDAFLVSHEVERLLQEKEPNYFRQIEHRIIRRDGEIRHIVVQFNAVLDDTGHIAKTIGVNQDITERKKVEDKLKQNEERYRNLFMAQFDAFALHEVIVDAEGQPVDSRFLAVNPAFELITGLAADKVIGKTASDVMPNNDPQLIKEFGKVGLFGGCLRFEDYSEDFGRYFEVSAFSPKHMQFAVLFRDVTERHIAAMELTKAKEAAEAANITKSVFLANMSHEIRTPLNGILSMLQLLDTTHQNSEQKDYVQTAIRSSKRLTSLLSDLLDLSRIEAGKLFLHEDRFELITLKEAVFDLLSLVAQEKGLELIFELDERLPSVLVGDEPRMRQILLNLVGNAVKFTQQGVVRVDVSPLPHAVAGFCRVLFTVTDTGIGIDDEQMRHIFEPFVQGESSYVRRYQGAGLGLTIVMRLVKLLGAAMTIDSQVGAGTTMYLSIPLKVAQLTVETPAALTVATDAGRSLRILFAEDDAVTRVSIKRLLEKAGHTVSVATNGLDALRILEQEPFDLILMDIQMPEMDGVEATRAIRSEERFRSMRDIPIIAVTAYAMGGDRERFRDAGMTDYISKPVDIEALKTLIARIAATQALAS